MKTFFGKRCLLVVTGASRGLGLEISRVFSAKLAAGSTVVLMARNSELLQKNCKDFAEKFPEVKFYCDPVYMANQNLIELYKFLDESVFSPSLQISFHSFASKNEDAKFADYEKLLDEHLKSSPEAVVVVHNAGSLGSFDCPLSNQTDDAAIDRFLEANVRHPMLLSAAAISKSEVPLFMINISSLSAVKALKGVGLYCTAKAARKMYFECLAEENPSVRILQYSPGPLDTDFMEELRNSAQDSVAAVAKQVKENGTLLTVTQTTLKLCEVLEKSEYKSGAQVDYYDR